MITLAGQPLLLPDSDGELLRWQEAFQAARQYDLFAEPATIRSSHNATNYESTGVGLPIGNYADPPEPRINTLYWPTGATRWARGYFMATGLQLPAIIKKSSSYSTAVDLKIANIDGTSGLTIKVFVLPPRPIAVPGSTAVSNLYLIPVVDERYFWNHQYGIVDLSGDPAVTWSELFDDLMTNSGASAANSGSIAPEDAYLVPDKIELQRRYENVALLLDAVCLSTGYRFVTKFDGKHTPEKPADSQAIIDDRNDTTFESIAGGQAFSSFAAAATLTTFNKYKHGRPLESRDVYTKSVALSVSGIKSRAGTVHVVQSSLLADYSTGSLGNGSACDDLATQIEADYAAWAKNSYDTTIAGVSDSLIPCGHDDSILITFGAQRYNDEKGEYEYEATTRVKSYPLNFGVEQQLSQDPYIRVVSHFQDAIPAEDVDAGTSGDFYFYDETGTALILDENDDPKRFEVHNEWGPDLKEDPLSGTGANYDRVRVHWQEETEKWEIVKVKNLPRRGKTSGAVTGGSGTVKVYDDSTEITGYTVGVTSFGDVDDDKWVIYDWINGHWEIVSAEC